MYKPLLEHIDSYLDQNPEPQQALEWICTELQQKLTSYDWVGFYFHNSKKKELY